jgi:tetratricopeptide (TPR) repeat protein
MQPEGLSEGSRLFKAGQFDEAAQFCRALLTRDPSSPEANHLLGLICYHQGRNADARDLLMRATISSRATGRMYSNLGAVLDKLGETEQAVAAYRRALDLEPDNPWPLNNLGVLYRNAGRAGAAIEAFEQVLALKPDFADAQINLRLTYADLMPQWHFAMMNDSLRNDAYEAAIRRAVAGRRVLDIGTGAGLLALMAAAAGAESVVRREAQSIERPKSWHRISSPIGSAWSRSAQRTWSSDTISGIGPRC